MFKNEYILSVDIKKQMTAVVPTFVQFDNATLLFKIYDDGKPFNFTGFTKADVSHKRPDGTFVMGTGTIETLVNGEKVIRYTYVGNEMNQVGFVSTSLSLHSSDKKVSIQPFKVEIISDMTEEAMIVAPETGILQELIANVSSTIARIDGAIKNANTAIENANTATNTANNALTVANQAVTNANVAAKNANDKAAIAETATNNANAKANFANEKALVADTAASTATNAAKNANDVTATANQAILNTNTAIDNLNKAIVTANSTIHDAQEATADAREIADSWKFNNAHDMKIQYVKNNIVSYNGSTFIAIKNNIGVVPVGDASDIFWKLLALKGDDGNIVLYREIFDGVKGQTTFTLSNHYDRLQNRIHLDIGGVLQYSPMHFMETSTNSITLNYPLESNMKVIVTYFGEAPALINDLQLQIDELNKIVQVFNLVETINSGKDAREYADYAREQADYAKEHGDQAKAAVASANLLIDEATTFKASLETALSSAQDITQKAITTENNARLFVDNTKPLGTFELTSPYKKNNIVLNNGSSWIALTDTQHNPLPILPVVENNWWRLFSQKGVDGKGSVSSVNGIMPDVNGNLTLNALSGTIVKIDGLVADINGEVVTHTNKSVLDGLSSDAGKLKFNGQSVSSVTSVNGETGVITGLETVANSNNKLNNKVDKVSGKQLSTEDFTTAEKTKLTNVQANANNYVHPSTHPASIIVQDANNRFVTDSEKAAWNSKPSTNIASTTANGLMSSSDKTKLNSIETGAQVNSVTSVNGNTGAITGLETTVNVDNKLATKVDKVFNKQLSTEDFTTAEKTKLSGIETSANNYVHPTTHPASIIVQDANNRFVTDSEKASWDAKANTTAATTATNGLMSSTDKTKLNGIAANAEVNQNTFSNITVGSTTISSNSKTATLKFEAGNNITLTPSTSDNKIIISATTSANYDLATNIVNGLMSSTDKVKLDGIATGANNYTHPTNHPASIITQDASNRFVTDAEKTTWNAKANNSVATTSVNGLMSSTDKTKLNDIETGAQVNTVTSVNGSTGAITGLATASELLRHSNDFSGHIYYMGTDGMANTYTVEINYITKYVEGMGIAVKINVTNTGESTININGLGAIPILKGNGYTLRAGNLKANSIYTLRYNGMSFIVQGEGGEYGTADASHVLSGYTIGTETGIVSGTIPYQGTGGTVTPTTNSQSKPSGYYTSNIIISGDANLLSSNIKDGTKIFGVTGEYKGTYGTAGAAQVLSTHTIGTENGVVSGSIVNRGAGGSVTPSTTNQTKSSGYYSSDITIVGDTDLVAANIKDGVNIFGVAGNFKGNYGTATASQVLSGYSVGTNLGVVSGTMPDRTNNSTSPGSASRQASGSGYIDVNPANGYYNGSGTSRTRVSDANFTAANIVKGVTMFGLTGTATGKFSYANSTIYIQSQSANYQRDFYFSFNAGFSPKAFGYMISGITTYYQNYRSSVFVFFPEGVGTSSYTSNGSTHGLNAVLNTSHVTSGGQSSFASGNYVYIYGSLSSSFNIDDQTVGITGFAWG